MATAHPHALQDTFLEHVRKHDVPVTVFLANGIRLQGTVAGFDSYALLLVRDRQSQLIYKHAISTILPSEPDRMAHTKSRKPEPIPREPSLLSLGVAAPSSPRQVLVNETWYECAVSRTYGNSAVSTHGTRRFSVRG